MAKPTSIVKVWARNDLLEVVSYKNSEQRESWRKEVWKVKRVGAKNSRTNTIKWVFLQIAFVFPWDLEDTQYSVLKATNCKAGSDDVETRTRDLISLRCEYSPSLGLSASVPSQSAIGYIVHPVMNWIRALSTWKNELYPVLIDNKRFRCETATNLLVSCSVCRARSTVKMGLVFICN